MSRISSRLLVLAGLVVTPMVVVAQTLPQPPLPPQAPQAPQAARPAQAPRPAQDPQQDQARPQAAPRPLLSLPGQAVNVRVEVTITDQSPGAAPVKKTVALVLADRTSGMVRSESVLRGTGQIPLHIDAEAALVEKDRVLVQIGVEYNLPGPADERGMPTDRTTHSQIRESFRAILQDGKPLVISESADPMTDRKVVVEVKATILR